MIGWEGLLSAKSLALSAAGFAVVAVGMGPLIGFLSKRGLMAVPNERSNHSTPKPEGGGLLVLAALIPIWFLLADRPVAHILVPATILAGISWLDDTQGLSPLIRFPAHILAVCWALWFEPSFIFPLEKFVPEPVGYAIIALLGSGRASATCHARC